MKGKRDEDEKERENKNDGKALDTCAPPPWHCRGYGRGSR